MAMRAAIGLLSRTTPPTVCGALRVTCTRAQQFLPPLGSESGLVASAVYFETALAHRSASALNERPLNLALHSSDGARAAAYPIPLDLTIEFPSERRSLPARLGRAGFRQAEHIRAC